jgi:hypothetical protein
MANQVYTALKAELIGDGASLTATIILDSTPIYVDSNVRNFQPAPNAVYLVQIRDEFGNSVPATATLSKNGKQILITFSAAFTGTVTVTMNLGYNV